MKININCRDYEVEWQDDAVAVGGSTFKTAVVRDNGDIIVRVAGRPYKVKAGADNRVFVDGRPFTVEIVGRTANGHSGNGHNGNGHNGNGHNGNGRTAPKPTAAGAPNYCPEKGAVAAPMPGTVLALRVAEGEQVAAGAVLLILEAMKMQNEIKAPNEGTVKRIFVSRGQTVGSGDVMITIE